MLRRRRSRHTCSLASLMSSVVASVFTLYVCVLVSVHVYCICACVWLSVCSVCVYTLVSVRGVYLCVWMYICAWIPLWYWPAQLCLHSKRLRTRRTVRRLYSFQACTEKMLFVYCTLLRRVLKIYCFYWPTVLFSSVYLKYIVFIDRLYSSQACTENKLFLLTCCILLRRVLKIYCFVYWPIVLFSGVYWKYIGFIDRLYQSHILFIDRLYSSQYWTCIVLNWLIVSIPDLLNSYCFFIERLYKIQECT